MFVQFSVEVNRKDNSASLRGQLLPSSKPATIRVFYSGTDMLAAVRIEMAHNPVLKSPEHVVRAHVSSQGLASPEARTLSLLWNGTVAANVAELEAKNGSMKVTAPVGPSARSAAR